MKISKQQFDRFFSGLLLLSLSSLALYHAYDRAWLYYVVTPAPENLSFQFIYDRVIEPRCTPCHGNSGDVNLESYPRVKEHAKWIRQVAVELKKMPPKDPLNGAEIKLLRLWIDSGAPEQATSQTPAQSK